MTSSSAAAPTRADIYSRVSSRIIADIENGVRLWLKPWNTGKAVSRITKPLRGNGQPYKGINVVMLWGEAIAKGYASPTWLTYRQAVRRVSRMKGVTYGSMSTRRRTWQAGAQGRARLPRRLCQPYSQDRHQQRGGLTRQDGFSHNYIITTTQNYGMTELRFLPCNPILQELLDKRGKVEPLLLVPQEVCGLALCLLFEQDRELLPRRIAALPRWTADRRAAGQRRGLSPGA